LSVKLGQMRVGTDDNRGRKAQALVHTNKRVRRIGKWETVTCNVGLWLRLPQP